MVSLYAVAVVLFNDNVVFSLEVISYLHVRARGQVFVFPKGIIAHYDVFFLSDFFFKFSNCFAIVLHFTESFH